MPNIQEARQLNQEQVPTQENLEPSHDAQTQETMRQLEQWIGSAKKFEGGLGRVAAGLYEGPLYNPEAREKIYTKQVGKAKLDRFDAQAFEPAGGSKVKNFLLSLVSDKVLKGGRGYVDTSRRKPGMDQPRDVDPFELIKIAKKLGLELDENTSSREFSKKYVEGGKEITRFATEKEASEAAAAILEKELRDLETKTGIDAATGEEMATGANLIKEKANFEVFLKELEKNRESLEEAGLLDGLTSEKETRQNKIQAIQEQLDNKLEIIRTPLVEHRDGLAEALEEFGKLLDEAKVQEKVYENQIKKLRDKIKAIGGSQELIKSLGVAEKVEEWKKEDAQAKINLADFRKYVKQLNDTKNSLLKSKTKVEATLVRIDKMGKTQAEIQAEQRLKKAPSQQAPQREEQLPTEPGVSPLWKDDAPTGNEPGAPASPKAPSSGAEAGGGSKAEAQKSADEEGFEVPIKFRERKTEEGTAVPSAPGRKAEISAAEDEDSKPVLHGADDLEGQTEIGDSVRAIESDDMIEEDYQAKAAAERAKIAADSESEANNDYQTKVAAERAKIKRGDENEKGGWFRRAVKKWWKPVMGMGEPKHAKNKTVEAPAPAEESNARELEPEAIEQREEITKRVWQWLNGLFKDELKGRAKKVMERRFRIENKPFDFDAQMTQTQAEKAYREYLIEYEKRPIGEAEDLARAEIQVIAETKEDAIRLRPTVHSEPSENSDSDAIGTSEAIPASEEPLISEAPKPLSRRERKKDYKDNINDQEGSLKRKPLKKGTSKKERLSARELEIEAEIDKKFMREKNEIDKNDESENPTKAPSNKTPEINSGEAKVFNTEAIVEGGQTKADNEKKEESGLPVNLILLSSVFENTNRKQRQLMKKHFGINPAKTNLDSLKTVWTKTEAIKRVAGYLHEGGAELESAHQSAEILINNIESQINPEK